MKILLLATILLPIVGTILILAAGSRLSDGGRRWARQSALVTTLLVLGLAVVLVSLYPLASNPSEMGGFAVLDISWLGGPDRAIDIRASIGLDGLSIWLFAMTGLLMVVAVLVSWEAIRRQAVGYYSLLLMLETGLLGIFVARDIILFCVFCEFTAILLFFLIGLWGSGQRRRAAGRFFLFALAGGVLTLLGLLAIVLWDYYHPVGDPANWKMTFSIAELGRHLADRRIDPDAIQMPEAVQVCIFLVLCVGFAIRVPLLPLHSWLPAAAVEAPTAGSLILAGVFLKVGIYGFARFALPMLPEATALCAGWLLWVATGGIIYGGLLALAENDIKRLVAYSCLSHLGFCTLGLFALNRLGTDGGVLQMVNHGLSTGGLLALVGMLHERYHTRQIEDFGGLAQETPLLALFMSVMALSSIGLPGLNGFAGQFLVLLGIFQRGWGSEPGPWSAGPRVIAVLAVVGVALGAWYMLRLVHRVLFGAPRGAQRRSGQPPADDLSPREISALLPLVVLIFWIGLQPRFFLDRMSPTLNHLTADAIQAAQSQRCGAKHREHGDDGPPATCGPVPIDYSVKPERRNPPRVR